MRRVFTISRAAAGLAAVLSHRERFAGTMLAELRGVIDEDGHSPFWDAIGGRFFGMTFPEADEFNAVHGTQFIADLFPKTPAAVGEECAKAAATAGGRRLRAGASAAALRW